MHRIGQTSSVVIHYLVARGTSDDTMWPMIESKLSVLGNMGVSAGDFRAAESSNYQGQSQDEGQTSIVKFFKKPTSGESGEEGPNKRQKLG